MVRNNKKTPAEDMRSLMEEMKIMGIEDANLNEMDLRNTHGVVSYENPVSLHFGKHGFDDVFICEGLIKTYPIDKTIEYIRNYFNLGSLIRKVNVYHGKEHIQVNIPNLGRNEEILTKSFDVCGYYMGNKSNYRDEQGNEWLTLQFEAKFQKNDSDDIRSEETYLYHLTPSYNEKKILNSGLSPRCRNNLFNYPDRIYMFRGTTGEDEIINIGKKLNLYNSSRGNDGQYTIFKVDVNSIPEGIEMFLDPNLKNGVFVSGNIPPKCIVGVGHVDFTQDNTKIDW